MNYEIENAEVLRESQSGKALLIGAPDFDKPRWIPKSVIGEDSELWKTGQEPGTLTVEQWFAEKEGLL